jgi:hypothetical protein
MAGAALIEAAATGAATTALAEAATVAAADDTPAQSAVAVATKAAKVFRLRLPSGHPCLWDTGSVVAGPSSFFLLPFGRPCLCFSGTPSPPALGRPMADMVRLCPGEGREAEEEVKCTLDPERPRHLKRSEAGERAAVMGSAKPYASVTAPLSSRHACPREDNRRSHYQR